MAFFLNELGSRFSCKTKSGKSSSCGMIGALGGEKMVPFDIPVVGGEVSFDMTDAIVGALGGKVATGIIQSVVYKVKGAEWANWFKVIVGGASIVGLMSERMRESSMFLGFSFATFPETAEPVLDFVTDKALWGIEKVTGATLRMLPGASASGIGRRLGQRRQTRRIGQGSGVAADVRPLVNRPADLLKRGMRSGMAGSGISRGGLNGSQFDRPIIDEL